MNEIEIQICSLCGDPIDTFGNNPWPLASIDQPCCDNCNATLVLPAREKHICQEEVLRN